MIHSYNTFTLALLIVGITGKLVNFEEHGAIADDLGLDIAWKNGGVMNETLNSLQPGQGKHFDVGKTLMNLLNIRGYFCGTKQVLLFDGWN